jgi:hypothetical protein
MGASGWSFAENIFEVWPWQLSGKSYQRVKFVAMTFHADMPGEHVKRINFSVTFLAICCVIHFFSSRFLLTVSELCMGKTALSIHNRLYWS